MGIMVLPRIEKQSLVIPQGKEIDHKPDVCLAGMCKNSSHQKLVQNKGAYHVRGICTQRSDYRRSDATV
jgi:hypothetical protein